jgi:outer membrane protein OmpA-like peptidoglycan-associated protein
MMRGARRLVVMAALGFMAACAPMGEERLHPPKSFFVFFAVDSVDLSPEAGEVLDRIADEARRIQATGVGIAGYASPAGTPSHNLRLSDLRATAVEVALLSRGVPKEIVVRTYHGATPIIGPEIEGQRVEIVVSLEDRSKRP